MIKKIEKEVNSILIPRVVSFIIRNYVVNKRISSVDKIVIKIILVKEFC